VQRGGGDRGARSGLQKGGAGEEHVRFAGAALKTGVGVAGEELGRSWGGAGEETKRGEVFQTHISRDWEDVVERDPGCLAWRVRENRRGTAGGHACWQGRGGCEEELERS